MPSGISDLPLELLIQIRYYLDCRDFRSSRLASRQLESGTFSDLVKRGPYKVYVPYTRKGMKDLSEKLKNEDFVSNVGAIIIDIDSANRCELEDREDMFWSNVRFLVCMICTKFGSNNQIDIGFVEDSPHCSKSRQYRRCMLDKISEYRSSVRRIVLERDGRYPRGILDQDDILLLSRYCTVEILHSPRNTTQRASMIWQENTRRLTITHAHGSWISTMKEWLESLKVQDLRMSNSSVATVDLLTLTACAARITLTNVTLHEPLVIQHILGQDSRAMSEVNSPERTQSWVLGNSEEKM